MCSDIVLWLEDGRNCGRLEILSRRAKPNSEWTTEVIFSIFKSCLAFVCFLLTINHVNALGGKQL